MRTAAALMFSSSCRCSRRFRSRRSMSNVICMDSICCFISEILSELRCALPSVSVSRKSCSLMVCRFRSFVDPPKV